MSFHERTADAARGRWRGILMQLGVPESLLTGRQGPCPVCGGNTRFRFDDKDGRGTSYCNTCGSRDGFQLAEALMGQSFSDVASRIDVIVGNLKPDAIRHEISEDDRVRMLRETYLGSRPIAPGDLAHTYLASRGVEDMISPKALRFHPALRDGDGGIRPALLAMVGIPGETKFATIHRTFLRPDGRAKAEMGSPRKLMPGPCPDGACVVLAEYLGSGPLGIAEGVETALSAAALFEMPVWSAISADMLAKWSPPEGCHEVVVFGDRDPGFAGQACAYALARRLASRMTVTVRLPDRVGEDWADVYLRSKGVAA